MSESTPTSSSVLGEQPARTVWPTIAAMAPGRFVGRMASIPTGFGLFFTVGTLMAAVTIPISLAVFAWQLMPWVCRRYSLTTRRIIIRKGLSGVEEKSLGLDQFDSIDVQVLPGQAWHHAGELVFRRGEAEVFRLTGVSRPEVFRQNCLKTQQALLSVRKVIEEQAAQPVAAS